MEFYLRNFTPKRAVRKLEAAHWIAPTLMVLKPAVLSREDLLPTQICGQSMSRENLVVRNRHEILVEDHKISQFARLNRALHIFLKRQVRAVDGVELQRILTTDLLIGPIHFSVYRRASDVPMKRKEGVIIAVVAMGIGAVGNDYVMIQVVLQRSGPLGISHVLARVKT